MQLAVLEFTPIMPDIQTVLNTMSNMVVNHVQITQAVCAGFPIKSTVHSEVDTLLGRAPGVLHDRDVEKVHLCAEIIFGFLSQQLQPHAGPTLQRYACPGFFQTLGYIMVAPYHDPAFFKEFVRIQNSIKNNQRPDRILHDLGQYIEQLETRIAVLTEQENTTNIRHTQKQIAAHQSEIQHFTRIVDKIRIEQ